MWVVRHLKSRFASNDLGVPIRNFGVVVPGTIFRGARPTNDGYAALRSLGVETVVTLMDGETRDDGLAARAAGLRWYELPLSDRELPSFDRVKTWLQWARTPSLRPIYIHCDTGIHRTGGLVAAYRIAIDGWTNADALAEAERFGFYADRGHAPWDYFIRSVTPAELAADESART